MLIKRFIGKVFRRAGLICNKISSKLLLDKCDPTAIASLRVTKWFKDNGDRTHRLNYELDSNSVVFDLGGYEGQWSSDIFSMYGCRIFIFEPYIPFAKNIEERFKKNKKFQLYKFGLGARTEKVEFAVLDNGSSIYAKAAKKDIIDIVSVIDFLETNKIDFVDLIKINIEGGEYELLECLIEKGLLNKFKNIQVQFHDFIIPDAEIRMKKIQNEISKTHFLTYEYHFVWENWTLKNSVI